MNLRVWIQIKGSKWEGEGLDSDLKVLDSDLKVLDLDLKVFGKVRDSEFDFL